MASLLAFTDPRPDLVADHHLWTRALEVASDLPDSGQAFDLMALLHCLRCEGTTLARNNHGTRLEIRRGTIPEDAWTGYYRPKWQERQPAFEALLTTALIPAVPKAANG